ncbi:MAG TPA: type I 3-dehydroquinate dehydratase [Blastocatellia bacterium]|nr:type I 3-dehydroquinate dehydratase [Blastocatellia bacterium]
MICAVITEPTIDSARTAIKQAASAADMIELRLDYLTDFDFGRPDSLIQLLANKPVRAIITCRAAEEGGKCAIDDDIRLRLLVEGARTLADYCDVEAAHYERAMRFKPDLDRLIVSYHNFEETPPDLPSIYDRVCALPAAVHKIVTRANSISDTLAIFKLLDRASEENRKLIALAMGEAGLITRILGPSRGSFLTYGSLRSGAESAPGQLTCQDLNEIYGLDRITKATQITGIIGNPVSHSASPAMHNAAFQALGLDYVYVPFEVERVEEFFTRFVLRTQKGAQGTGVQSTGSLRENSFRRLASDISDSGFGGPLRGFSVTIPHKTAVIPFLDEIDPTSHAVGAVNTVVIDNGLVRGYNDDVQGAVGPLARVCDLASEHCAVIGAGGSARAVIYGLKQRGARVSVFARDPFRAREVGEAFAVAVLPLEDLASSDAGVVINTTPVGMHGPGARSSPVPREVLRGKRIVYDLVYNPIETQFLRDAKQEGCQVISGLETLVAQAASQFARWTGKQAPVDLMRKAALRWMEG